MVAQNIKDLNQWVVYLLYSSTPLIKNRLAKLDGEYSQGEVNEFCRRHKKDFARLPKFDDIGLNLQDFFDLRDGILARYDLRQAKLIGMDEIIDNPVQKITQLINEIDVSTLSTEEKAVVLYAASASNNIAKMQEILDTGLDINTPNELLNNETALAAAILIKSYDTANFLLDNGANPNAMNTRNQAAYFPALITEFINKEKKYSDYTEEQLNLIGNLVAKGADLTLKWQNLTPLEHASTINLQAFAVIKYHLTDNTDPLKAQLKAYIDSGFKSEEHEELTHSLEAALPQYKHKELISSLSVKYYEITAEAEKIIRPWAIEKHAESQPVEGAAAAADDHSAQPEAEATEGAAAATANDQTEMNLVGSDS